ncbi:MAG: transporter substrate-binding domain-containing protein [Desulfonauticus sp.]|nr:transporter substrate-binding domain-containing protein [Desulfonauticus sp.]
MQKLKFIICLLLILKCSLVFAQRKLVIVGDRAYAPFEFLDAKGNPQGIFVDIWKLWSQKTGIPIEYRLMNWIDALNAVKTGKADVVGGLFYSSERKKYFLFSKSYLRIESRIFFNKNMYGVKDLNLQGFKVGVVKGDYAEDFLHRKYPNLELVLFDTSDKLVKAACKGEIDVFVGDAPVMLYYLTKYGGLKKFSYSSKYLYRLSVHAAVNKHNKTLLKTINEGFDKIKKDEIKYILNKWQGLNVYKIIWNKYKTIILFISILVVVLIVIIIFFKYKLSLATDKVKQQNIQLQDINDRLNTILYSIGDGVIATDKHGKVILLNSIAEQLTGWKSEEARGLHFDIVFNIVNEKTGKRIISPFKKVMNTGQILGLANHTLLIRKDGNKLPILDSVAPIKNKDGETLGVVVVFRDATIHLERQKKLLRMQKLESLSLIASGIAHDFNNLLTAIIANIGLLKQNLSGDNVNLERLGRIENASLKAKDMVQRLMVFSKDWKTEKKGFWFKNRLKDIVEFMLVGSGITVEFDIDKDLFPILGDEVQISQVIENIVLNAKEAMEGKGKLIVRAKNFVYQGEGNLPLKKGEYVQIVIQDSGPGIDKGILDSIFEPYFSTKVQGSGLGLAASREIILDHNGYIDVKNIEGGGACFCIYVPRADDVTIVDKSGNDPELQLKVKKVLFLDDEEYIREMMQDVFEELGLQVNMFAVGQEAYEEYVASFNRGEPYDLVVLDLTIPGEIDGVEVGQKILAFDPEAKIVLISGYVNKPIFKEYRKHGFAGVLRKPFTLEQFVNLLSRV